MNKTTIATIIYILGVLIGAFFLKFGVQTNRIKISLLSLQDIQRNVKGIADALDKKSGVKESISSGDRD